MIDIILALSIGIYYLWRYKKNPASITLLWALAFISEGGSLAIYLIIEYGFSDFFINLGWDYYHIFQTGGILLLTIFLALSTFYIGLFNEKITKLGKIIISCLGILGVTTLIIDCCLINIFDFASLISRIVSLWIIIFFCYFSFHYRNYRILTITIGLVIATITGILMAQFHGTLLDIIGHIVHYTFYFFIAYGLFFTRPPKEKK